MMHRLFISFVTALLVSIRSIVPSWAASETPVRVVQVDLDYVYDVDPIQQEQNLHLLVERIAAMKINTVFLQAFADPEGTGLASALYFPNSALPVRTNLFGRAVEELKTRAKVRVFGWLPVLSFELEQSPSVLYWSPITGRSSPDSKAYRRLSPFDAETRHAIADIYEDMAKAAPLDGILFHDDALLSDFEDASPEALDAYARAGFKGSIKDLRAHPETMKRWSEFKTKTLVDFTKELTRHVRLHRPQAQTARNIYATVALQPHSQEWFAQDYDLFLKSYDYTAVMAMPKMENVPSDEAEEWMQKLVTVAKSKPNGLKHTVFELQAVDWNEQAQGRERTIPSDDLASQMRFLSEQGAENFGYYPDDFVTNTPDIEVLAPEFSLRASGGSNE
ncbi:MAG: poly-beta-1,6-N-acetyl-D-glucosamine N-deacetylase PgaB [Alphaproteobacteria bacterium]